MLSRKHNASDFKFKDGLSRKHDASDFKFKGVLSRKHDASDFKYERYTNFFTKVNFKYLGITIFYLNVENYNRLYCELISNYLKCLGLPRIILTCIYSHRIIHAVYLRLTLNHDFSWSGGVASEISIFFSLCHPRGTHMCPSRNFSKFVLAS